MMFKDSNIHVVRLENSVFINNKNQPKKLIQLLIHPLQG